MGVTGSPMMALRTGLIVSRDEFDAARGAAIAHSEALTEDARSMGIASDAAEEAVPSVEQLAESQRQAEQAARAHTQALQDDLRELNGLIDISQANTVAGQGFIDLLKASGNELLLTGDKLIQFRVENELMTQAQANFVAGQETVLGFLERYPGDLDAASAAFAEFQAGHDNSANSLLNAAEDAEQAGRTYSGLGDAVRTTGEAASNSAADFDTANKAANTANTELDKMTKNLTNVKTQMTPLGNLARDAFESIKAGVMTANPALAIQNGLLDGIEQHVKYLLAHSNINLHVNTTQTGSLPASGGGSDFVTSGPMLMMVGDNPGGVERVKVTPISGKGITRGLPGGGMAFAGGTGGTSNSVSIGQIILPNVQNAQDFIPDLRRQLNLLGYDFMPMVGTG